MLVFGPAPSRRLGHSLGVNNVPPKICSYACVYCQVGQTTRLSLERRPFYPPAAITAAVTARLAVLQAAGKRVDAITFVPDGEPTLDLHLAETLAALHAFGIRLAVISNASLIWRADVRAALCAADWVSLKMDAVRPEAWRRVNRAHGHLDLPAILEGAVAFAHEFGGTLVTETMLVHGRNDAADDVTAVADYLTRLRPHAAYLSVPTRPPAEPWVRPPAPHALARAHQVLADHGVPVEYLIAYEGDDFIVTGDAAAELLHITAVHPMRETAVHACLARAGAGADVLEALVTNGRLVRVLYEGHPYYVRAHA